MAKYSTSTSRSELEALQGIDDADGGYPAKGKHVGGGRHVAIGADPVGPGWTRHAKGILKHPDRDEWAYPSNAAEAKELGPDWKLDGEPPPGQEKLGG